MTLRFADGFDDLVAVGSTPSMIGWTNVSGSPRVAADRYTGDTSGRAIENSGVTGGVIVQRAILAADQHATNIFGIALTMINPIAVGTLRPLLIFYSTNYSVVRATVWLVGVDTTNNQCKIEVRAGSTTGGTLLATTTVAVVDNAGWYYVEVKYVVNSTTGSVTIRVNEIQVASATGIDTTGGAAGTVLTGYALQCTTTTSATTVNAVTVDDFYDCNAAGSANNDFLGDVRVARLRPSAAGDLTQWTPTTGSNWDNVNNFGALTSTPYNAEGTDEEADLYACDDLPASATGAVKGVVRKSAAWCSVLNVGIALLVKDSTTIGESAEFALATTVATSVFPTGVQHAVWETKPSGGTWSTSDINAMQIGQRVKSIT